MEWIDPRSLLPGLAGQRVHVVSRRDEARLLSALGGAQFTVVRLDGGGINGAAELFAEIARALELPGTFGHNWDALADVLGEALARKGARVAFFWRDASQCLAVSPQVWVDALLLLDRAAAELALDEGPDPPVQVEVFVFLSKGARDGRR